MQGARLFAACLIRCAASSHYASHTDAVENSGTPHGDVVSLCQIQNGRGCKDASPAKGKPTLNVAVAAAVAAAANAVPRFRFMGSTTAGESNCHSLP